MTNSSVDLIIGGSSGIGLTSAKQLVSQGTNTVILGNNEAKLEAAKTELKTYANNDSVEKIQANLYEQQDVDHVIQAPNNETRHIKYLVNAADYFNPKPFIEHTPDDYNAYTSLNSAAFFISQAVAKNMIDNGGGSCCTYWFHVG